MLNSDVTVFQAGLNLVKAKSGVKFVNAVVRNTTRIKRYLKERDRLVAKQTDDEAYQKLSAEIQKDRVAICEQYCERDKKNNPVYDKDQAGRMIYKVPEDMKEEFEKTLSDSIQERQEVLEEMMGEKRKAIADWGEKEANLDIYMIPESYLPDDIKGNELEGIIWMVKEMQEELEISSQTPVHQIGIKKPKS